MNCKAQFLGHRPRHFAIKAMELFAAPAVKLNMAEQAITDMVAGNQRASIAGPEIVGWDIPERDAGAQARADHVMQRGISAEDHRLKMGNSIGNVCDAPMKQTAKVSVWIDLMTCGPHHHCGFLRAVFSRYDESRRHPHHLSNCGQHRGRTGCQRLSKELATTHGGSIGLQSTNILFFDILHMLLDV